MGGVGRWIGGEERRGKRREEKRREEKRREEKRREGKRRELRGEAREGDGWEERREGRGGRSVFSMLGRRES